MFFPEYPTPADFLVGTHGYTGSFAYNMKLLRFYSDHPKSTNIILAQMVFLWASLFM